VSDSFEFEQLSFDVETARKTSQAAIRPHNTVTGQNDWEGVFAKGLADCAGSARLPDRGSKSLIANDFTPRYLL